MSAGIEPIVSGEHRLDVVSNQIDQHPVEHLPDQGHAPIADHRAEHVAMLVGVREKLSAEGEQAFVRGASAREGEHPRAVWPIRNEAAGPVRAYAPVPSNRQAALRPGQVVLDVGCGTGSLAMLIDRLHPAVEVVGVNPDPKALARARRKAIRAALSIRLDRGFADALPYPDAYFDRVFSCFVYYHLRRDEKEMMLSETRRALKPGGLLCLLDFDGPEFGTDGSVARWLHSSRLLLATRKAAS